MRCILHIGTRKTGSSSIQSYLKQNAQPLSEQGYLMPACLAENGFQIAVASDPLRKLWYYCAREDIKTDEDFVRFRDLTYGNLRAEIAEHQPHTVILSSEDLSLYIDQQQTDYLRDRLSMFSQIDVLCYIRRQDRYIVSDFSTGLLNGGVGFPLDGDPAQATYLNYKHMIDLWAGAFGREAITLRIFEPAHLKNQDLITDFCDFAGLDSSAFEPGEVRNASVTAAAQAFLRVANEALPGILPDGSFNWKRGPLNAALLAHYSGAPPMPPRAVAKRFYDFFRDSNEALRKAYLPDHPAPLFAEDFQRYPEAGEEAELTFHDGAELAVRIWSEAQEQNRKLRQKIRSLRRDLGLDP